jgi:hypothetical protein
MGVKCWASVLLVAVFATMSHAQTFTSLASLTDKTGAQPTGLGQQANGMLWVTTKPLHRDNCVL